VTKVEEKQYREELMEWCDNIYFHWERMKPSFSKSFDLNSLEDWEESYVGLREKLESDIEADIDEYHTARSLYEQWELLYSEITNDREKATSEEWDVAESSTTSDKEIRMADPESSEDDLLQMTINIEITRGEFRKILSDYKMEASQPK
jgi:hypothetical protein